MKIRFRKNTNIRTAPGDIDTEPLGIVYAGTVLDIEDEFHDGASIRDNNKWFRDHNGWYYWSGETEIIPSLPSAPAPHPPAPAVAEVEEVPIPAVTAFPTALPLPEEPLDPGIPSGETRLPGFQQAPAVPSTPSQETTSAVLESVSVTTIPAEPLVFAEQPVKTWADPDPERLNWGIENYELHRHLWQEHQLTGRGVSVALLSTGALPSHPDLAGAIARSFNADGSTSDALDQHGIGTQAAILVGGRGRVVFGVAPEASLLIGKIGEYDQGITPESLVAGLDWAIDAGAHIIALLVDFRELNTGQKQSLQEAINRALARNVLLLAPVGNSIERRPEDRYPASLEGVLSVGAHDIYGQRCAFSAKSYQLDLLAPGEGLLTSNLEQLPTGNLKSTVIATAFTAGLLALIRQRELQNNRLSTPGELYEYLRGTAAAHKTITKGNDVEYGYGLLNPNELLKAVG